MIALQFISPTRDLSSASNPSSSRTASSNGDPNQVSDWII